MARIVGKRAAKKAARDLGKVLAELRAGKGWTQRELAEKVGVDPVTVSRWEGGLFGPSAEHLGRLVELYGVSVDDVLNASEPSAGPTETQPEPDSVKLTEEEAEVLRLYRATPPDLRRVVRATLRETAEQPYGEG